MSIKYSVFILFLLSGLLYAGTESDTLRIAGKEKVVVDSIRIVGNEITKEFIITREMTFAEGDTVDAKILDFNRERIYSVGIFNFVDIDLVKDSSIIIAQVSVKESWYIYPIPFLHLEENSLSKSTYGLNLLYKNFRGRDETIRAILAFGHDPAYTVEYYNPVLLEEEDISFRGTLFYSKISNKSKLAEAFIGENFEYLFTGGAITFGKRLNQFNQIYAGVGFSYAEAPDEATSVFTASEKGIDRLPYLTFTYGYDTRDLTQFPKDGRLFIIDYTLKGIGVDDVIYHIFKFDYREYRLIYGDLKAKWRGVHRRTLGKHIPTYDKSYLGYGEYIRGHKGEKTEGDNYVAGSFEMSYPIFNEWNLSFKLPLIPRKLTSARLGMHIGIFVDSGAVFENETKIADFNFSTGYGVGITFLVLPYNAVRFEYSFNEQGDGEFLIGSGFSF